MMISPDGLFSGSGLVKEREESTPDSFGVGEETLDSASAKDTREPRTSADRNGSDSSITASGRG